MNKYLPALPSDACGLMGLFILASAAWITLLEASAAYDG